VTAGVTGGILAGAVFKQIWKRVAGEEEAPEATDRNRGWGEVVVAAALQGAVFAAVKAIVDRAGAQGFSRWYGEWPGDE
jgi:predicted metal-dependent enzyme (double-stranded beta helix superfamily)